MEISAHDLGGEDRITFAASQTKAMLTVLSLYFDNAASGNTDILTDSTLALYAHQMEQNLADVELGLKEMREDHAKELAASTEKATK